MKKAKNNKQNKKILKLYRKVSYIQIACLVVGILVGLIVGFCLWQKNDRDPRYTLASSSALKGAQQEISDMFKKQSSTECDDNTDPISPADRQQVFDEYLRVNKYANRAVIRSCNDIDIMLTKNPINNKWEETSINLSLDLRANPAWQVECLIDDITKADDTVRPENSSIDTGNLIECRSIKEREQVVDILDKSGTTERSEIKQDEIDFYIKASEDFRGY